MNIKYLFSIFLLSTCFCASCSTLSKLWEDSEAAPIASQQVADTTDVKNVSSSENTAEHTGKEIVDTLVIYADETINDWKNWSWDTTVDFASTAPVIDGATSMAVTYDQAWAGLYLHINEQISGSAYDTLQFWIHGGKTGGQKVRLSLTDGENQALNAGITVSTAPNQWTQVNAPLADLGSPAQISGIIWQDASNGAQPTLYIDSILLLSHSPSSIDTPSSKAAIAPTAAPTVERIASLLTENTGLTISVDVSADRYAISPDIYGINFAEEELATILKLPVRRWGGNHTSRYNWQKDTFNSDNDWFFESTPVENNNPDALPTGSATDLFVEQDRRLGTKTLLTIPMIGWTTKDREFNCGFSVAKYGPQQRTDPWRPDCGNGITVDGTPITGNDPADTSIATDTTFAQAWIQHLVNRFGTAAEGGVAYYALDNEPMIWNETHRDIHPEPLSYDELRDRTYAYAAAIKQSDPTAQTLGPVFWGWTAYFYSALDRAEGGRWWNRTPDRSTHAGVPLVPWYLQQMREYEQENGIRILDYLDLHYYPRSAGVALAPVGNEETATRRLRTTRSLWDRAYVDESWIEEPVYLIPRMREWVEDNYPGTKLAITEYNWGALDHINGALTQADVLGIFGRERLDLATLWEPLAADQPYAFAFRMYRNYDGAGSTFGDINVQSTSTDQDRLSVYAAQHSTDGLLTIILINKTSNTLISDINLQGVTLGSNAQVYRYSSNDLKAIVRPPRPASDRDGFSSYVPRKFHYAICNSICE